MRLFDPEYPPIPWPVRGADAEWRSYWADHQCGPGFKSRWHAVMAVVFYRAFDRYMGYWEGRSPRWYDRIRWAFWA